MTIKHFNDISAMEAIKQANLIAVGPFIFQAVVAMRKFGILQRLGELREEDSLTAQQIAQECKVTLYCAQLLLDVAETVDIVIKDQQAYRLSKIGMVLVDDKLTNVNFDFTNEVCYQGLASLTESLRTQKPVGLKTFTTEHDTIYPIISSLPTEARKAWFAYDHFYSDHTFQKALEKIWSLTNVTKIIDVGGNSGRFALEATSFDKNVQVTIVDLPQQCALALKNATEAQRIDRITTFPVDILKNDAKLPNDGTVWWMSQFLDCFSAEQIHHILQLAFRAMPQGSFLVINELFADRQKNEIAKLVIETNSLYFTALANGVSRFYHADEFLALLQNIGFKFIEEYTPANWYHTLLILQKL